MLFPLPDSNHVFITTSRKLSEEGARELVYGEELPGIGLKYMDYSIEGYSSLMYNKALDSLFSLIRSVGGDPDKANYAILRQEIA